MSVVLTGKTSYSYKPSYASVTVVLSNLINLRDQIVEDVNEIARLDSLYFDEPATFSTSSLPALAPGTGQMSERFKGLLAQIRNGVPLIESEELSEELRRIARTRVEGTDADIETWSHAMSEEMNDIGD